MRFSSRQEDRLIDALTALYCIIGNPVSHSLSPAMHNAAFRALGINAVYLAFKVDEEKLQEAVEGFKAIGVRGFNVTIPFKRSVVDFLDELDEKAAKIGAVNTVKAEGGKLFGFNTDGMGFIRSLEEEGICYRGKNVLIIGAGGASRAICAYLSEHCNVTVVNRTAKKAESLAADFGLNWASLDDIPSILASFKEGDLIVNTTSVGLKDEDLELFDYERLLKPSFVVVDIIYGKDTKLLKSARKIGCKAVDGEGMLLYQGVEAFKIWTGKNPPIDVMRKALKSSS